MPRFTYLEYDGQEMPLVDWARRMGTNPRVIRRRLEKGWPVARALGIGEGAHLPAEGKRGRPQRYRGGTMAELAAQAGISYQSLRRRMKQGHTLDQALALPDHRLREHRRTHPPLDLAREADSEDP